MDVKDQAGADKAKEPGSTSNGQPEAKGHDDQDQQLVNGASEVKATTEVSQNGPSANHGEEGGAVGGARPKVRGHRRHRRTRDLENGVSEADSSDSDRPTVANTVSNGGGGYNLYDSDDSDGYVYTYTGSRSRGRRVEASTSSAGDAFAPSSADMLSADLPKSFYPDTGSESESGGGAGSLPGVSGAGQSNLSEEVAALLQTEMASSLHVSSRADMEGTLRGNRRRRRRDNRGAAAEGGGAENNHNANNGDADRLSPEFLEMDFVDSGDERDSDQDSGQGADENVTETNEEDSEADPAGAAAASEGGAAGGAAAGACNNPWGPPSPPPAAPRRQPDLPLPPQNRGEKSKDPPPRSSRSGGVTSAPAVTPVREDLSLMVRSRSLNSPLARVPGGDCPALMARGESDPAVSAGGSGDARIGNFGGSGRDNLNSTAAANMEACGTRLSQREALLFQGPPTESQADSLTKVNQEGNL